MSDWLLGHLRALLNEDPDNSHIQGLLRRERKLFEARGNKGSPPARMLNKTRQRLLAGMIVPHGAMSKDEPPLPIDMEIRSLITQGLIPAISSKNPDREIPFTAEDALWSGRIAVVDGCAWGDYYARFKLGREVSTKARAKIALSDTEALTTSLAEYLYAHADVISLGSFVEPHRPLSSQIKVLRDAQMALNEILDQIRPSAVDQGGRPGNPWRVGFVYGVSHRWVLLTQFKISDSERFLSFVEQAAASVDIGPRLNSDMWSSAIHTAKTAFKLGEDGRSWLRQPGDPPWTTKPTP